MARSNSKVRGQKFISWETGDKQGRGKMCMYHASVNCISLYAGASDGTRRGKALPGENFLSPDKAAPPDTCISDPKYQDKVID